MTLLHTLTKDVTDRTSTWRFVETADGLCALGGNYKVIPFRNKAAMTKSLAWFISKGFEIN